MFDAIDRAGERAAALGETEPQSREYEGYEIPDTQDPKALWHRLGRIGSSFLMRTNFYIDAFNLYYGRLKGTPYKWLNLEALCQLSFPNDQMHRIRSFTARVKARPHDPQQPVRLAAYLRALGTLACLSSVAESTRKDCDFQLPFWSLRRRSPVA